MQDRRAGHLSRRRFTASLAVAAAHPLPLMLADAGLDPHRNPNREPPLFEPAGPDAAHFGATDHYPVPGFVETRLYGNPFRPSYRVGAFSHADKIYPSRLIRRADTVWQFQRHAQQIRYSFKGNPSSVDEYLARNPVTGLLMAIDDTIICERYQYGRTDSDRMLSQSMVKSIIGLLTGIAVSEAQIQSIDDETQSYVPGFKGAEYGRTRIRDLLHMASGVAFGEEQDNGRDLNRLWRDMVTGPLLGFGTPKGTVASLTQFNQRVARPGTHFQYASIEPDVVGTVLRYATQSSLSDYIRAKIWQPIGAEADAAWALDAEGAEIAHFGFNAVLRDYARLGRLCAWDGAWNDRQIIPRQWMIDATSVSTTEAYLAPGNATPWFGYGYFLWLLPGSRRQFAFLGANGQRLCVDPAARLVMVQTALEDTPEFWRLWTAFTMQFSSP